MRAQPVEWVLIVYYGPSAHRATYGRLDNTKYTKDYIQLSKKKDFLDAVTRLFPVEIGAQGAVPLTYRWPKGTTPGSFVFNSADRPHLKWETNLGAPQAWRMSLSPGEDVAETIPGDPTHTEFDDAENELSLLASRGAGQPYLVAVKLHDEPTTLHLRAYLDDPAAAYSWADLRLLPDVIRELAAKTSQRSALAWTTVASGGVVADSTIEQIIQNLESTEDASSLLENLSADVGRHLSAYLGRPGYGLFFNPSLNHDAWTVPTPISEQLANSTGAFLEILMKRYPAASQGDAAAEATEPDLKEVELFQTQINEHDYSVSDSTATIKTRGSAQRAFANAVKFNYGYRCAITGIESRDFLIASHIVPWSEDHNIRLDPSNGICLSLLMDRAFEKGHLLIDDDLTVHIDWGRVGSDAELRRQLENYDGTKLALPKADKPQIKYLQRRRRLVGSIK